MSTLKIPFVFKPDCIYEYEGVEVIKFLANKQILDYMDPLAELVLFKVKLPQGFPDHPHKGIEGITYIFNGTLLYEDIHGNKDQLHQGDVQWMTTGKGTIHSEIPASSDQYTYALQLWIASSQQDKLHVSQYKHIGKETIPVIKKLQNNIKIISGEWNGNKGILTTHIPSYFFHVQINKDGNFEAKIPIDWSTIIFVYEGELEYKNQNQKYLIDESQCIILERNPEEAKNHQFYSFKGAKFILISAQPSYEHIVSYDTFVANDMAQLQRQIMQYQCGYNGFEGKHMWTSQLKKIYFNNKDQQP